MPSMSDGLAKMRTGKQAFVITPVLEVNCEYKHHITFEDTILIKPYIKEYNGVRMTVGYEVKEKNTGKEVILAETKHCFTNKDLRPINLKKQKDFSEKFENLLNQK